MSTKVFTGNIMECTEYEYTPLKKGDSIRGREYYNVKIIREGVTLYRLQSSLYVEVETGEEYCGQESPNYQGQVYINENSLIPHENQNVVLKEIDGELFVIFASAVVIQIPATRFNLNTIKRLIVAMQGGFKNKLIDFLDILLEKACTDLTTEATKERLRKILETQQAEKARSN